METNKMVTYLKKSMKSSIEEYNEAYKRLREYEKAGVSPTVIEELLKRMWFGDGEA